MDWLGIGLMDWSDCWTGVTNVDVTNYCSAASDRSCRRFPSRRLLLLFRGLLPWTLVLWKVDSPPLVVVVGGFLAVHLLLLSAAFRRLAVAGGFLPVDSFFSSQSSRRLLLDNVVSNTNTMMVVSTKTLQGLLTVVL